MEYISCRIHYVLKIVENLNYDSYIAKLQLGSCYSYTYRSTFECDLHELSDFHRYERINVERAYITRVDSIETRSFKVTRERDVREILRDRESEREREREDTSTSLRLYEIRV